MSYTPEELLSCDSRRVVLLPSLALLLFLLSTSRARMASRERRKHATASYPTDDYTFVSRSLQGLTTRFMNQYSVWKILKSMFGLLLRSLSGVMAAPMRRRLADLQQHVYNCVCFLCAMRKDCFAAKSISFVFTTSESSDSCVQNC
jgi:hypothetical protein